MTGDTMKSELIGQSKIKIESRHSGSKRRMARNPAVCYEYGDFDADLKLAIQESLKLAKQEGEKERERRDQEEVEHKQTQEQSNGPAQTFEEPKVNENDSQEMKQLKELMLLHLDLIEQQQSVLLAKDKQISKLKKEKEALQCRLERMERRMSLLSRSQEKALQQYKEPVATVASPSELKSIQERGVKRKATLEPQSLNKKFASAKESSKDNDGTDSITSSRSNRSRQNLPKQNNKNRTSTTVSQSLNCSTDSIKDTDNKALTLKGTQASIRKKGADRYNNVFRTDYMYVTNSSHETRDFKDEVESPRRTQEVKVPTWKLNQVTNCYVLEGTENLTDEIFLKRHQKPENEEKRRKRWDMQRLREQKMLEKLEQGRYRCHFEGKRKKEETTVEALGPCIEDAQFIEVCDKIPVSAFGYPIPSLEENEFHLPWFDVESKEKEDKLKTLRHKRR